MPLIEELEHGKKHQQDAQDENGAVIDIEAIGWHISDNQKGCWNELQLSHKQITDRFVELLKLFERYTQLVDEHEKQAACKPALKRAKSDYLIGQLSHHKDQNVLGSSISDTHFSLTTLVPAASPMTRKLETREMSAQTSKTLCISHSPRLKHRAESSEEFMCCSQHTLHFEVESVYSETELARAPLRQRLRQVCSETFTTLMNSIFAVGDDLTYVFIIFMCVWCVYLILVYMQNIVQAPPNARRVGTIR